MIALDPEDAAAYLLLCADGYPADSPYQRVLTGIAEDIMRDDVQAAIDCGELRDPELCARVRRMAKP